MGTFYFLLKQISNFTLGWICEVLSLIYSHFSECLVESWGYGYDREKIFFFLLSLFMFLKLKQFDVFYKGDDFSFLTESTYRYLMHFLGLQSFLIPVYHKYGETGISKLKSQTIYLHLYFHYRYKFSKIHRRRFFNTIDDKT